MGLVFFASWRPRSSVGRTGREAAPGFHSNIQGLNFPHRAASKTLRWSWREGDVKNGRDTFPPQGAPV